LLRTFPVLKWNFDGALIGRLQVSRDDEEPLPLPYQNFLLVPLLQIDEYHKEVRFQTDCDHSTWAAAEMADILNAFTHYAFLQSGRSLLFKDLQGNYAVIFVI
jgi:hypothetical protein